MAGNHMVTERLEWHEVENKVTEPEEHYVVVNQGIIDDILEANAQMDMFA